MSAPRGRPLSSPLRSRLITTLRSLITVVSALFVAALPASAQMGSSAVYSDGWVDSSAWTEGSDPSLIKIVGFGATQDNYNYYGHKYWVVTKITSPSGRTASATSYSSNSYSAYVSIQTSLPVDINEPGNYETRTQHWLCCPYMGPYNNCYPSSTTTNVDGIAIRNSGYRYMGIENNRCLYQADCAFPTSATCGVERWSGVRVGTSTCAGPWLTCRDIVLNGQCSIYRSICFNTGLPPPCN